jgi:hypothetical protein
LAPDRLTWLSRGVNISHWFRFPPRTEAAELRGHLPDRALAALSGAGFTFVRLAVQPEVLAPDGDRPDGARLAALLSAITRIESRGLAVVVEVHPQGWRLEDSAADRSRLESLWKSLAPTLAGFDPGRTFPEIVNEPVFHADPGGWELLQSRLLTIIRRSLPNATVVLSGNDWSSLDGLLRLRPLADRNVVYSFHFYEPAALTTLGAFEPGLDPSLLARLPFPVASATACGASGGAGRTLAVVRYYCAEGWDVARVGARVALAGAWARHNRVPVVMTEFGAASGLDARSRLAWIAAARSAAEREGLGWALWAYDDPMGFGVAPSSPGSALNPTLLSALGMR